MIFIAAGVPVAVINREDEQGQWLGWWIGIAVVALVVGLVWALAARSRAPQLRQLLDGLTPAQYRQVSKAVLSGPIPADLAIRRAWHREPLNVSSAVFRRRCARFWCGPWASMLLFRWGPLRSGRRSASSQSSMLLSSRAWLFFGGSIPRCCKLGLSYSQVSCTHRSSAALRRLRSDGIPTQMQAAIRASPTALTPHHRYDDAVGTIKRTAVAKTLREFSLWARGLTFAASPRSS